MTINYLIEKEYFSRRLEYVIRIISHRLGYPFRLISDIDSIEDGDTTIAYYPVDNIHTHDRHFQINVFNSRQLMQLEDAEKIVSLFEWKSYSLPVIGRRFEKDDLPGCKYLPSGIFYQKARTSTWIISSDIFLNVFYHLSRYEEKWRHFTEETATDYSTSILSRHQNLRVPVVDVLIAYLDEIIKDRIIFDKKAGARVLAWPGGEEMGIAFTHDLDITRGLPVKDRLAKISRGYVDKLRGKKNTLESAKDEIKENDALAWNLPELINLYNSHQWQATFFFIAKMVEGRHIRYNINSRKFRRLFKDLITNDHEIALHPSKFAFDRPKSYRDEKNRLESISGQKIEGMRQHFLRAKFPRLWVFSERAGLAYDSSLGYNYQAGFRAGTCHPFKTYDVFEDKPLSVTEFSLHFFENNLPDPNEDYENVKQTITNLIREVALYKGLLVGLLHPNNFGQKKYHDLWAHLLSDLKKRNVFVATLQEHLEWQRRLERIKLHLIDKDKDDPRLIISLPSGTKKMSFELIGDMELLDTPKNKIINFAKGCYTIVTDSQRISLSLKKYGT